MLKKIKKIVAVAMLLIFILPLGQNTTLASPSADNFDDVEIGSLRLVGNTVVEVTDLPLKHTDVEVEISGFISRVVVTQTFVNPYKTPIEAVYVFPLPDEAAVDDMEMHIGDRIIKAEMKERDQAKAEYEQAKQAGKTASLLEQERPNIFTQSVANIMPGDEILIKISYVEILKYENGQYEFVFPMVVGPRYIPGNEIGNDGDRMGSGVSGDTDVVPDASRITPPILKPTERSGHDINVKVNLNAGVVINNVVSPSHQVAIDNKSEQTAFIELNNNDKIPNKDFVLRYNVAGDKIAFGLLTHKKQGDEEGYFTLILQPQNQPKQNEIIPKEMIFVVDKSGSMNGNPIVVVKKAMTRSIDNMNEQDTFNILSFSNTLDKLSGGAISSSESNKQKGKNFVNAITAGGGTAMLQPFKYALEEDAPEGVMRLILVMTDGDVGNENEILSLIQDKLKNNRIFMMGVDSASNRYLLDRVAEEGKGAVKYVIGKDDPEKAVDEFYKMFANPVLMNANVDWSGLKVNEVYPKKIPDLYSNQPLYIYGKYTKGGVQKINVKGYIGSNEYNMELMVDFPEVNNENSSLASVWARQKIKELMSQMYKGEKPEIVNQVTELGIKHHIMTKYTSFVAVDQTIRNSSGESQSIMVPVELPEGKVYESIVGRSAPSVNKSGFNSNNAGMSIGFDYASALSMGTQDLRVSLFQILNIVGIFLLLFFGLIILFGIYKQVKYYNLKNDKSNDKEKTQKAITMVRVGIFFIVIILVLYVIAFFFIDVYVD